MNQNKGHTRDLIKRSFVFATLLLLVGFIIPGRLELKANVCPDVSYTRFYPADFLNTSFQDFRGFSEKQNFPSKPINNKLPANSNNSEPLSDQCYFKVGHRIIADKGPETALLVFSGIFLGYPFHVKSFLSQLPFVILSSRFGNCFQIRPPPDL
jgi:hypothetical protein